MKRNHYLAELAISPQQNAAKFYKDYQQNEKVLTEQIAAGEAELRIWQARARRAVSWSPERVIIQQELMMAVICEKKIAHREAGHLAAQKIHGSHVIIAQRLKRRRPTGHHEAMQLAAYFAGARTSGRPYARQKRQEARRRKARHGHSFDHHSTITPDGAGRKRWRDKHVPIIMTSTMP